ncbi:MAG TPA: hypothetical protein VM012_09425 [Flavitalea sp.]|nr:hypothetical protein [Flavitalea sp.]
MRGKFYLVSLLFISSHVFTQPGLKVAHKQMIAEAISISNTSGNAVWPGFADVPFTLLLLTDSAEYLFFHNHPGGAFIDVGFDSVLNTTIYSRPSQLSKSLLATYPAVNGISTIIVGTPENTGKSPAAWIITLLHEHFHQYQQSMPSYYQRVQDLDLSKGDETGMWMLNYSFPYDSAIVNRSYHEFSAKLSLTVRQPLNRRFHIQYRKFKTSHVALRKILRPDDYRYFQFQVWQEGIARYTEYAILEHLLRNDTPIRKSPFYASYKNLLPSIENTELENLMELSLPDVKRIHFYSAGFALGMLLDRVHPQWKKEYFSQPFSLDSFLKN